MTAIPVWLTTGNGPFTVVLTPQTVSTTDGTLSDGTTVALTGVLDDIQFASNPQLEDISPMSTTRSNMVRIKENNSVTMTEIMKSAGTNILAAQAAASDVFKVVITRGAQAYTFYGRRGAFTDHPVNGKSAAQLTLEMVDTGAANPGYA
jgi:hypothetical protein